MSKGSFTHPWSLNILKFLLQDTALPANPPCVGLGRADGTPDSFIEFRGAGYQRVVLDASYFTLATTGEITLLQEILFPISTGYSGETYSIGFFTNTTTDIPFAWGNCGEREVVKTHDRVRIKTGSFTHYFSPGSTWSMWLKNAVLNHFYRGEAIPLGGNEIEIGYCTTPPNDLVEGTEPTVGDYSRLVIGRNSTNFKDAHLNGQELNTDLVFEYASAPQGTVTNVVYFIDGQYIMWHPLPAVATINANQRLALKAGQLYQLDP